MPRHRLRAAFGPCSASSARWSARMQPHAGRQPRRDMRVVGVLARRVDDQEQHAVLGRIGRARHHQVVEDAAILVGATACSAGGRARGRRCRPAPALRARARSSRDRPGEKRLAHVRDVEQAGLRCAYMIVLGDDAVGVLHRHVVAGERHHAGAAATCSECSGVCQQRRAAGAGGASARRRAARRRLRVASVVSGASVMTGSATGLAPGNLPGSSPLCRGT